MFSLLTLIITSFDASSQDGDHLVKLSAFFSRLDLVRRTQLAKKRFQVVLSRGAGQGISAFVRARRSIGNSSASSQTRMCPPLLTKESSHRESKKHQIRLAI